MKLFYCALIVSVANANQALPPGYQDQIHCPPDNCEIYTNPYGFSGGAQSSFHKCYNPTTDEVSEGVWTGSKTNVTAPEGYIEPEECTASEYSECDEDSDCNRMIDSSCRCVVSSNFHPFHPIIASTSSSSSSSDDSEMCTGDECDTWQASCNVSEDTGAGTCTMDYIQVTPSPTPPTPVSITPTKNIPARCDSDDQCYAAIRGAVPKSPEFAPAELCSCYPASELDADFDTCEGDDSCAMARCGGENVEECYDREVYCDVAPDDNDLGQCAFKSSSSEAYAIA